MLHWLSDGLKRRCPVNSTTKSPAWGMTPGTMRRKQMEWVYVEYHDLFLYLAPGWNVWAANKPCPLRPTSWIFRSGVTPPQSSIVGLLSAHTNFDDYEVDCMCMWPSYVVVIIMLYIYIYMPGRCKKPWNQAKLWLHALKLVDSGASLWWQGHQKHFQKCKQPTPWLRGSLSNSNWKNALSFWDCWAAESCPQEPVAGYCCQSLHHLHHRTKMFSRVRSNKFLFSSPVQRPQNNFLVRNIHIIHKLPASSLLNFLGRNLQKKLHPAKN